MTEKASVKNGSSEITTRMITECPDTYIEDIVNLYRAGGWWKDSYDPAAIPSLVTGSFTFVVAELPTTGKIIGMGRVISDGVSDAYIQDVVVLSEFRRRGIGSRIVQKLVAHCQNNDIEWIGLIAEPGSEDLYKMTGFTYFKGKPMIFSPSQNYKT